MYKKVLITGGAGFLGSNLALRLLKKGYAVTVLDNLSEQVHGKNNESYSYISIKNKVNFIKGDVRNREDWLAALNNNEIIVHLAAETGTGQSMYKADSYIDTNIRGTAIFMDILARERHSVKKVILASSRAVYGEGKYRCKKHKVVYPYMRLDEDMRKGDFEPRCPVCHKTATVLPTDEDSRFNPSSIYGITKQTQEQMLAAMGRSAGINYIILRYQNIYGPGQSLLNPYTGILSVFSTRIKNNNEILIFEDGKESRDFVYIDDAVDATILGIEKEESDFDIFNVGSGVQTSVFKAAKILKGNYNSNVAIRITGNYRAGDVRHNYADLARIKKRLGFNPRYNFNKGLSLFTKWVDGQKIQKDNYCKSIAEMKDRGLFKQYA